MAEIDNLQTEIAQYLVGKGSFIADNPACSYGIRSVLSKVRECEGKAIEKSDYMLVFILNYLNTTISDMWNSISSIASGYIDMETQLELIKDIGGYWRDVGTLLSDKIEYEDFAIKSGTLRSRFDGYRKKIDKEGPKEHFSEATVAVVENLEDSKKSEIIKEVLDTGAFLSSSEPIFMMRSGYRSFYFFDSDRLIMSPENRGIIKKAVVEKIRECIRERNLPENKVRLGFIRRGFGETGGVANESKTYVEELNTVLSGVLGIFLPPPTTYPLYERLDGARLKSDDHIIILDDVVTTGGSAQSHIDRLEKATDVQIDGYIAKFYRKLGEKPEELENIYFESIIQKEDLIQAKLWKPEILNISLESPYLPAIDMTCDYLYEINIYENRKGEYQEERERFIDLLKENFDRKSLESENFINYSINMLLLSHGDFLPRVYKVLKEAEHA